MRSASASAGRAQVVTDGRSATTPALDYLGVTVEPLCTGETQVSWRGNDEPRHHVAIAGTGRAGTSFLVRFLGACGLDVGTPTSFDERARAGLEHDLLDDHAPYVVKSPWMFVYCDRIDPQAVALDALIVPVRDLMASATSRMLQERTAMAEGPWANWPASDVNCTIAGGAVYSLDPVDQARILAVGFHRLIYWATVRQVPLFLLEFPRAVNDGEYLIDTLWPWLSAHCTRDQARAAFDVVAEPGFVRIGGNGQIDQDVSRQSAPPHIEQLDREAMVILLKERNALLAAAQDELAETREVLGATKVLLQETRDRLADIERLRAQSDASLEQMRTQRAALTVQLAAAAQEIDALRHTVSWRITRPIRTLRSLSRRPPT